MHPHLVNELLIRLFYKNRICGGMGIEPKFSPSSDTFFLMVIVGDIGVEPMASCVEGRRSSQLS